MKLSTLIGKPVLTRAGERLGYVTAAYLTRDMKKLSSVLCADDNEEDFCLPARAILSAADAVIAGAARLDAPTGVPSPIGKAAYTNTGEALGILSDVETGETPLLLIAKDDMTISCEAARAAIGETVIVYPTAAEKRPSPAKRGHAPKQKQKNLPMSADPLPNPTMSAPAANSPARPTQSPPAMSAERALKQRANAFRIDRTNLLGRRVKRSVYDEAGSPIATAGELVTPEMIARARRKNKLLALTVNTLTNLYD